MYIIKLKKKAKYVKATYCVILEKAKITESREISSFQG